MSAIYVCDDGNAPVEISADSADEAAAVYVSAGDWGDHPTTIWVRVWVYPEDDEDDRESHLIPVHPEAPDCIDPHDHDWQSPEWLGGCEENPGVWGHGGGAIIREVCARCGVYRRTDTWAQDPDTGEQGLESIEYLESDTASEMWVEEADA